MNPRLSDEDFVKFNDKLFPKLTIREFTEKQLNIKEDKENVLDVLYEALSEKNKTAANKVVLEAAMNDKVNASGAIILMVNTNEGLQLVYGNSARRKKVFSTNGQCEAGESMADTALREFAEELGNPEEKGILHTIVKDSKNYRSLAMSNQIGKTASEIAEKIIKVKVEKKGDLYINMSVICVNSQSVNIRELEKEIQKLSEKLKKSADYYRRACKLRYTKKDSKDFLADPEWKIDASNVINEFKENCGDNITPGSRKYFGSQYDSNTKKEELEKILKVIIDLTENNQVSLLPKAKLQKLLSLDLEHPDWSNPELKDIFFASLQNIAMNKGKQTADDFLSSLENLASNVSEMNLGFLSSLAPKECDVAEESNSSLLRARV